MARCGDLTLTTESTTEGAVSVQWVGGPYQGFSVNVSYAETVEAFTAKLAAQVQVDHRRVRLAWEGQVLVNPESSLADYGVTSCVAAVLSLSSVMPRALDMPLQVRTSATPELLPQAAIKRLDSLDLEKIKNANSLTIGFPQLKDDISCVPKARGYVYDALFTGKVYGLELSIGLFKGQYNMCYCLAGRFEEISNMFVEKNRPLIEAIKDYGRNLREILLEDSAECGLVYPGPSPLPDMQSVMDKLERMEKKAALFGTQAEYGESSKIIKWVPVLILFPVLLLSDEELELELSNPMDRENSEDVVVDGLYEFLTCDDVPRAFLVTWRLQDEVDKSGFQLLSSFAKE